MKRREFITLLGGTASAWAIPARGQQSAMPVIGFLYGGGEPSGASLAAFRKGLGEAGFVVGQNVTVDSRWAEGRYESLSDLAADLIRHKVAIIVAASGPAAIAAKKQTVTIPIVFTAGADPVRLGLVSSLNRPGGNLTGVNTSGGEVAAKGLGVLRDLLPTAKTIATLLNLKNQIAELTKADIEAAADNIGQRVQIFYASDDHELDAAFAAVSKQQIGAMLIGNDVYFNSRADQLARLAMRHGVPALYSRREFAAAGGLISYGPSLAAAYYQVGIYTGQILKGETPANLPVVLPTKFDLVLNSKTAKSLGVAIPPTLLALADEVIE